ncbi:GNAT family N-acetyltransferase [Sporosarcina luteola]|uniref:GNAT family N-acetyltransferase n=1 Tax=Sporosarcina luteola TaxID=582850 RepID=UPI0020406C39|nr:GNAT family N-acetyltransferase [Sporosarcina luteola]MCM3742601.1 GNAT family N-acetyltransferase [Sporosarcina luteola]
MNTRQVHSTDARQLVQLIEEVERTTDTMLYGAGERSLSVEQLKERIESFGTDASTILVAEIEGSLVGYLMVIAGTAYRNKHSAYIVIGVSEKYRGKGVGKALFTSMDKWAIENRLHRLELTVMTTNTAAIVLYEKSGFSKEGLKRESLFVGGQYVDEYYMAKLI